MRWGEHLEFTAEAEPGDFIYVPPFVPHQEINPSPGEMLNCVVARSGQEPIVVNVDIAPTEPPEEVYWVDPNHPHPFRLADAREAGTLHSDRAGHTPVDIVRSVWCGTCVAAQD